jgi:hypothetical protein
MFSKEVYINQRLTAWRQGATTRLLVAPESVPEALPLHDNGLVAVDACRFLGAAQQDDKPCAQRAGYGSIWSQGIALTLWG